MTAAKESTVSAAMAKATLSSGMRWTGTLPASRSSAPALQREVECGDAHRKHARAHHHEGVGALVDGVRHEVDEPHQKHATKGDLGGLVGWRDAEAPGEAEREAHDGGECQDEARGMRWPPGLGVQEARARSITLPEARNACAL